MSYIDGVGIVVVGGTSTDAGRIEVFNEDDNEWKKITQESFSNQYLTIRVYIPRIFEDDLKYMI